MMQGSSPSPPKAILFSDMDGTLAFERKHLEKWGSFVANNNPNSEAIFFKYSDEHIKESHGFDGLIELVALPPSSTGKIAFVSKGIINTIQELR